jgi:orotate phosphoribosyltransferase-like protein
MCAVVDAIIVIQVSGVPTAMMCDVAEKLGE